MYKIKLKLFESMVDAQAIFSKLEGSLYTPGPIYFSSICDFMLSSFEELSSSAYYSKTKIANFKSELEFYCRVYEKLHRANIHFYQR